MPVLSGGEAIIKSLRQFGIDTIFGLPGGQTYELFDAIRKEDGAIQVINSRHEQGVAYMAYGYARSTGRTGVYTVVPGPGVLNTTSALCTAYGANTPVMCIAGQIPSEWIDRGVGFLHEIPDQLGILRHLTKWAERIDWPAQAPALIHQAFRELQSGRTRPVAVEMAVDIMEMKEEVTLLEADADTDTLEADPDLIEKAAKLLARAKEPMIVIGSGAVAAGSELLEIAQALQAPVTTLWSGKGIIDERHYLSLPYPAGHKCWETTDVVLAIGTRLKFPQLYWGLADDLKIIRIDIDENEIDRIASPEIGIVADAGAALKQLIPALEQHNCVRESREKELSHLKQALFEELDRKVAPQMAILKVIREELPEDGFFVDEVTQVGYASWFGFPMYSPRQFITSSYQGNLGYGYATALGVQVANPGKKVIALAGDGGFMYQSQELATAVKYGLDVVSIVFNNNSYGNVKRDQQLRYNGNVIASELSNPDFVRYAESFGASGYHANNPEQLRTALKEAFKQKGPSVIEMPSDDMPSPWPYIMMPRVRSEN
jgi:acetolactate synthase I/II/III large subunit